jgi:NAD(P)H dehydrogenase (quinone)
MRLNRQGQGQYMDRNLRVLVMGATGQVGGAVVNQLKIIPSIDVVAAVASECLLNPARHVGNTYRLGYDAKTYEEIAQIMGDTLGKSFRYEARPPSEFLSHVLAAGAEPAYMKCVFDSYTDFTNGVGEKADEVFDNFPALVGRPPRLLSDFVSHHADQFRY